MRIALLTVNVYDNYGNTLQKYALYRTLEKFADQVEVFWHHGTKQFTPYDLELSPSFVGNVRASAFKCVRENKFKEFDDANMRTRFDLPDLEDVADEYDYFVVGSDQVWNPDLYVPGNFLEFAPPEKRIAYAASIAVPTLPAHLVDYYREKISEMPYVSIREAEGVDLVDKLTGKRPLRVLDPVFLLDADEWRQIAKPPRWLSKKTYENGYLLSYFFDGNPPAQVRALAEKLDLPVVNLLDLNNFDHYITGIEEFLYLVDHATLMCTQSFHGTAFALNFKTPVIVYKVAIGRMLQRFSRLESLLGLFGLSDRATDVDLEAKMEDPLQIDFTRRDEVMVAERAKALTFLKVALGLLPQEELPIEPPAIVETPPEPPAQAETAAAEMAAAGIAATAISEAETFEADTSEADTSEAETFEADTSEVDTSEADTSETDTSEADTSEAEISEAEPSEAETFAADTSEAETSEAETFAADTSEAETFAADTSEAETSEAETFAADTSEAETSEVETFAADTSEAETFAAEPSEAETFEADTSEAETSETEPSEAETFEAEPSEAETFEADTSEAETFEADTSETEIFEAEPSEAEIVLEESPQEKSSEVKANEN